MCSSIWVRSSVLRVFTHLLLAKDANARACMPVGEKNTQGGVLVGTTDHEMGHNTAFVL